VIDETKRHDLRVVFDEDALAYDRTRPVCPAQLFDDLVSLAGLAAGDRVAEIGPGTGQATVPLAERGMLVTALEIGAELALVARRNLARFPGCEVLDTSFEEWQPADGDQGEFGAVVACNSLHWVDPEVRYLKPFRLLRPSGAMVVTGCRWARPADAHRFWADVQDDYLAVGYAGEPPPPPEQIEAWHFPAGAAEFFDEIASRSYPFRMRFSSEDYIANLATQSSTHELGSERAAEFLARVRRRLEGLGSPDLTATFVGHLTVGRRVNDRP
jgi:SAM-dependent methyltransferase